MPPALAHWMLSDQTNKPLVSLSFRETPLDKACRRRDSHQDRCWYYTHKACRNVIEYWILQFVYHYWALKLRTSSNDPLFSDLEMSKSEWIFRNSERNSNLKLITNLTNFLFEYKVENLVRSKLILNVNYLWNPV